MSTCVRARALKVSVQPWRLTRETIEQCELLNTLNDVCVMINIYKARGGFTRWAMSICLSVCSSCLSPETCTCRALAWLAHRCLMFIDFAATHGGNNTSRLLGRRWDRCTAGPGAVAVLRACSAAARLSSGTAPASIRRNVVLVFHSAALGTHRTPWLFMPLPVQSARRQSVCTGSSIRPAPNLRNEWTDFNASWYKWSRGRGHEMIH